MWCAPCIRVKIQDQYVAFSEDELRKLLGRYRVPKVALRNVPMIQIPTRADPSQLEVVHLFEDDAKNAGLGGRRIVLESEYELASNSMVLDPRRVAHQGHEQDVLKVVVADSFPSLANLIGHIPGHTRGVGNIKSFISEHAMQPGAIEEEEVVCEAADPSDFVGVAASKRAQASTPSVAMSPQLKRSKSAQFKDVAESSSSRVSVVGDALCKDPVSQCGGDDQAVSEVGAAVDDDVGQQ